MKTLRKTFILTAIILVIALTLGGCSFINADYRKNNPEIGDSIAAAQSVNFNTVEENDRAEMSMADAVAAVERTSVAITTESGAGSGVIVDISFDDEGDPSFAASWKHNQNVIYIITCQHMVNGKGEILVYVPDENASYEDENYIFKGFIGDKPAATYESQGYAVTLVGGDFNSDIALLKLNLGIAAVSGERLSAEKIVKARIPADGYKVRKGETVFSVGNPTGSLPGSVAGGVVSYLERETVVSEVGDMTLMQISVSTNPGNSGGGLYNLYGELIGITNAGNTNYTDINFAIPCFLTNGNGFVEIAAQLGGTAKEDNYGYVAGRRQKFGFTITEEENEDKDGYVVYVSAVSSGSTAANAGLKVKDVIKTAKVADKDKNVLQSFDVARISDVDRAIQSLNAGEYLVLEGTRYTGFTTKNYTVYMMCQNYWFCNTGK